MSPANDDLCRGDRDAPPIVYQVGERFNDRFVSRHGLSIRVDQKRISLVEAGEGF